MIVCLLLELHFANPIVFQGNKVVASEAASINAPQYKYNDDARQSCTNPQADREAIESIEDIYFDASCDIISHELKVYIYIYVLFFLMCEILIVLLNMLFVLCRPLFMLF